MFLENYPELRGDALKHECVRGGRLRACHGAALTARGRTRDTASPLRGRGTVTGSTERSTRSGLQCGVGCVR
jgi:hypothetical protein